MSFFLHVRWLTIPTIFLFFQSHSFGHVFIDDNVMGRTQLQGIMNLQQTKEHMIQVYTVHVHILHVGTGTGTGVGVQCRCHTL